MDARGATSPAPLAAALLALLLCAATPAPAAAAAAAASAHERACGAAFGVLRHCAAAGGDNDGVRTRCCSLLEAFQHNGCLCPDCPPGASADATSSQGLLLGAELSPLADMCGTSLALSGPVAAQQDGPQQLDEVEEGGEDQQQQQQQQQQQEQEVGDEDDTMSDMAGLAAASQDPLRGATLSHNDAAAAVSEAAARAAELRRQDEEELQDTPEDDYDNLLSDADAAFMLVDPAVAHTYATRAASLAHGVAVDVAASLAAGRAAAAELEAELQARLEALLAGQGDSSSEGASSGYNPQQDEQQQQQQQAEAEAEVVASTSAVADSTGGEVPMGRARSAVLLARADAVPQTAEQRRAAALASAVERQQERHLALTQRLGDSAQGWEQQQRGGPPAEKLSLDITIDSDNPEAARRMVGSLAALLKSWQAAGTARSQEELAAALERTAAKVAAAAAPLGRAGLQPRQLLLQQVEEQGSEPRMCNCMNVELPPAYGPAPDLATALHRRYLSARLALCRFACQHQQTLAVLLVAELALCVVWLAVWFHRSRQHADEDSGHADGEMRHPCGQKQHRQQHQHKQQQPQFLIASAADPQWHTDLKQPLLGGGCASAGSSSSSC